MENPEEVLQALDEFQKMRPTEIPRELEDYLCWVAKTGDPVYQWPLVKALFREKLARVMSDFYESCPSLELAPCPNVESFNYDRMKSSLLERLESFANAPFTVQRICELLVAPRKEYNRVDKFMRAIEKNILVVSTREPGPSARPSENGDGMLNGFVEEDEPQPSTSAWINDCESTATRIASMHNGADNETPMLETVMPSTSRQTNAQTSVVKNTADSQEIATEKSGTESTASRTDLTVPNFIASSSEFTDVTNLTSQLQETSENSSTQNLPAVSTDTSGIVGEVPEAIINEDTSSQPSLDMENDENDVTDTRKLQTTFQAKDFAASDAHSPKFYERSESEAKLCQMADGDSGRSIRTNDTMKLNVESKLSYENSDSIDPAIENFLQTPNGKLEDRMLKSDVEIEDNDLSTDRNSLHGEKVDKLLIESSSSDDTCSLSSSNDSEVSAKSYGPQMDVSGENVNSINSTFAETIDGISDEIKEDAKEDVTSALSDVPSSPTDAKESVIDIKLSLPENRKPIIEEPPSEGSTSKESVPNTDSAKDSLTITETLEDETKATKSMVPDPIPIIEEPKDSDSLVKVVDDDKNKSEVSDESENQETAGECESSSKETQVICESRDTPTTESCTAQTSTSLEKDGTFVASDAASVRESQQTESMEVDSEESGPAFQQDEPMEQETTELLKS